MSAKIPSLHNLIDDLRLRTGTTSCPSLIVASNLVGLFDKDAEKMAGNRLHFIKMAAEK
ncbi:hypothetical protein [Flavitalea sp.]|nr:hypothetical protein [Flavitalea sp.]